MSFLGMGTLELLVVLLLAFIFLGPQRMVDVARMLGKATREVRRMMDEIPSLDLDADPAQKPVEQPPAAAQPAAPAGEAPVPFKGPQRLAPDAAQAPAGGADADAQPPPASGNGVV